MYSLLLAPARIKILIVPIHTISKESFELYCNQISRFGSVSISDLPQDPKTAKLTEQLYHNGTLYFEFVTTYDKEQSNLEEIQLGRQIFAVIGVIDCRPCPSLRQAMIRFQEVVQRYPSCLASRCFAFDPSDVQTDDTKGLIMIPNVGDVLFYLHTMLNDLTSDILVAFGSLVHFIITYSLGNWNEGR